MACTNPKTLPNGVEVVCRTCPLCISRRRRELESRINLDIIGHGVGGVFITLTLADEHLEGVCSGFPGGQPSYRQLSRGIMRFRSAVVEEVAAGAAPLNFRGIWVGEFGSRRGRAHYHGLLTATDDVDRVKRIVEAHWGHGFTDVKPAKAGAANYCAKYILADMDFVAGDDAERPGVHEEGEVVVAPLLIRPRRPALGVPGIRRLVSEAKSRGVEKQVFLQQAGMSVEPVYQLEQSARRVARAGRLVLDRHTLIFDDAMRAEIARLLGVSFDRDGMMSRAVAQAVREFRREERVAEAGGEEAYRAQVLERASLKRSRFRAEVDRGKL